MNGYDNEAYQARRKRLEEQIFTEKNRQEESLTILSDGYTLRRVYYVDDKETPEGYAPPDGEWCRLCHTDTCLFDWKNVDGHSRLGTVIEHTNGRHYLLFDEDLYGYSVLEIETGRCVRYMPEESMCQEANTFRETFIWCEAYYDRNSSLLAVEGCYWGCPSGIIVVNFADPMTIVETSAWYEVPAAIPNEDQEDDGDQFFVRWDTDRLVHSQGAVSKQTMNAALAVR